MFKMITVLVFTAVLISGCSPSDCGRNSKRAVDSETCETTTTTTPSNPTVGTSLGDVSYVPLAVFEKYSSLSGFSKDGMFQGESSFPYIPHIVINPIDSGTLEHVTTAAVDDFVTTINGYEIDTTESHPILQKLIGTPIMLRTALVFDLSDSTNFIDYSKLITEAKAYVVAAQADSDLTIANQEFTVWAFGSSIVELTSDFTSNITTINTALDNVLLTNTLGTSSNLNRAIVEVIGRYKDDTYDFSIDGDNDLVDSITSTSIKLSQLVVFSNGNDTYQEMDNDLLTMAIESQSFIKYVPVSGEETSYNKPVIYYTLGSDTVAGEINIELAALSEVTIPLAENSGTYSFKSNLILKQKSAVDTRINLTNQYLYRYAFLPRIGTHVSLFASKTSGYNYSLTTAYLLLNDAAIGSPQEELASLVEITGSQGEFISNNQIALSAMSTFKPATRWTTDSYGASDYSWAITAGTGTGTLNADGSFTVTGISVSPIILQLTNNTRAGQTASIIISN